MKTFRLFLILLAGSLCAFIVIFARTHFPIKQAFQNRLKIKVLHQLSRCPANLFERTVLVGKYDNFSDFIRENGCRHYVRKRGYPVKPLSEEESQYPLAFNFKIYHNFEQFERLFKLVYQPQNFYCIHVDAKADEWFWKAVVALVQCFSGNVILSSKRAQVFWSHFSTITQELLCFDDLIQEFGSRWDVVINLTGEEMPLHSNLELIRMAKTLNGRNWIGFMLMHERNLLLRVKTFRSVNRTARGFINGGKNAPPPLPMVICKGDVAGIFSRPFVHYLVRSKEAKRYFDWCKNTWFSDEHCIQSLHCNANLGLPGGYKGTNLTLRYMNYPREKWWNKWALPFEMDFTEHPCSGGFERNICVFDRNDTIQLLHDAMNRSHPFRPFANKFFIKKHPDGLRCAEQFIEELTKNPDAAWTQEEVENSILADERVLNCRSNND